MKVRHFNIEIAYKDLLFLSGRDGEVMQFTLDTPTTLKNSLSLWGTLLEYRYLIFKII